LFTEQSVGAGRWIHVSERVEVQTQVGRSETRHRQLRQHHLRHVDCVPVHHDGRVDHCPLLREYNSLMLKTSVVISRPRSRALELSSLSRSRSRGLSGKVSFTAGRSRFYVIMQQVLENRIHTHYSGLWE